MKSKKHLPFVSSLALLFCLFLVFSCSTTKYSNLKPCAVAIKSHDRYLVPWLPARNSDIYLKGLRSVFDPDNIQIEYLEQQEWMLRAAGIIDPLDSTNFALLQKAGYTHILAIKEISGKSAKSSVNYYTPIEINWSESFQHFTPTWNQDGNESEILLQLIPLDDIKATAILTVKTTISPLLIGKKSEGVTSVNLTTVESARYKAMRKGAKHLRSSCLIKQTR